MSLTHKEHSETADVITKYLADNSLKLTQAQKNLIQKTIETEPLSDMLYSADQMQFLMNLCKLIKAKKAIDVGVYTGYSAMGIASVLPDDGRLFALDITEEYLKDFCEPAWQEAGVRDKIIFMKGPASDNMEKLLVDGGAGTFDYVSIDADKVSYDVYYELALKLLKSGGIIAVDNILWDGKVIDSSVNDPQTVALRKIVKKMHHDERIDVSLLKYGDGLALGFKR